MCFLIFCLLLHSPVIRIPVAYLLAYLTRSETYPHGEPSALFGSLMFSWAMGMVLTIIVYAGGKWKKKMYASHNELE